MRVKKNLQTDNMIIRFWGVRGTLPVPGRKTLRYGGNTSCVTITIGDGYFFIFDAGSGIKVLSNDLLKKKRFPLSAKIFISHPHYDHINGLPFFVPLYCAENEFEILGGMHGEQNIEELISGQMDSIYFPVTINEFSARLSFRTLKEESFNIGEVNIQTLYLNHPGECLGYRVQYRNKIFCYVTDNEVYPENSRFYSSEKIARLIAFLKNSDLALMDATYSDEEYIAKMGWGHSSVSQAVLLAEQAHVKQLCLYHHDPNQIDADIDKKNQQARRILKAHQSKTRCIVAREGGSIVLNTAKNSCLK